MAWPPAPNIPVVTKAIIEETIAEQQQALIENIKSLQQEADRYAEEIEELNGELPF